MKKQLHSVKALLLAVAFTCLSATASLSQDTAPMNLNGQSFKIDLVDAQNNTTHDVLNFNETSFTCNAISNSTYNATRYQVTEKPDGSLFLYAVAISESEGTLTWKGNIENGTLSGLLLTDKPGQPMEKHIITGESRINTNSEE